MVDAGAGARALARGNAYRVTGTRGRDGGARQLPHGPTVNREFTNTVDPCHIQIERAAMALSAMSVPVTPGVELMGVLRNSVSVPSWAMA